MPSIYPTIQAGIDAASPGDSVLVEDGAYTENITIGSDKVDITLRSVNGWGKTMIFAADPTAPVLLINNAASIRVEGFQLRDSNNSGVQVIDSVKIALSSCIIANNRGLYGGGVYNYLSQLEIYDCIISGNDVYENGGGIYSESTDLQVNRTMITGNQAGYMDGYGMGGGLYQGLPGSHAALTNCLITGNQANLGAGLYSNDSYLTIVHCTVASNLAIEAGGAMVLDRGPSSWIANSIFWNNAVQAEEEGETSAGIWTDGNYELMVVHSDIQSIKGYAFWPGLLGNIMEDPLFDDPAPPALGNTGLHDYKLKIGSPCINTGTDNFFSLPPGEDYFGDSRPWGGGYDMGYDEFTFKLLLPLDRSWLDWLQTTTLEWEGVPGAAYYTYWIGQDRVYLTGTTEETSYLLRHGGEDWYSWNVTAHDRQGNSVSSETWRINYAPTTTTTTERTTTTTTTERATTTTTTERTTTTTTTGRVTTTTTGRSTTTTTTTGRTP